MIDFYFFLVGSILASFLGLVIDRFLQSNPLSSPASHCDSCQTRLRPLDLIPILSAGFQSLFAVATARLLIQSGMPFFELGLGLLFLVCSWGFPWGKSS